MVLVAPIAPATTGNGLAMRCGRWLDALADAAPVDLVVAPVAGPGAVGPWAAGRARRVHLVEPVDDLDAARAHAVAALADPYLRERLAASQPLPPRARLVPPALAAAVAADLAMAGHGGGGPVVVVVREHLVPFGLALARARSARRVVVDLDDDAEALARRSGHGEEADALARLARAWLPDADLVTLASPDEAAGVAARHGLPTAAAPNAVDPVPDPPPRPGADRLLLLGNLTYAPNVEAAHDLATEVLPRLRRRRPTATAALVGAADPAVAALAAEPGVEVLGPVPEVATAYAAADAAVVPLRRGAGTRIKVLEAFAHLRPVVATPAAVAGLDVRDGAEVLLGSTPDELAEAAEAVLASPDLADRLAAAGRRVADRYAPTAVAPALRQLALGTPP